MLATLLAFVFLTSEGPTVLIEGPVAGVLRAGDSILVDEDDAGVAFQLRWTRDGTTVATVSTDFQGVAEDSPVEIVTYRGQRFLALWTYWASGYGLRFVLLEDGPPQMRTVGVFENGSAERFSRTGLVYEYPRRASIARTMRTGEWAWVRRTIGWNQSRQRFDVLRESVVSELPSDAGFRIRK